MSKKQPIEPVFPVDPELAIREELLSFHALNPFIPQVSSARAYMFSGHVSQAVTINNGDEKIVQTGLEKQFGANTFSCKAEDDVRILKILKRYNGVDVNSVSAVTNKLVIVENIATGEIDYIDLPYNFGLHNYFGFKYKWNEELLDTLSYGDIVAKDTVFADSPTVTENSGYKFGINANLALMTIPETSEDGVVISQSMAERLSYTIFETRVVEFGTDRFPLNIYGDDKVYKPFPEIGEYVNDSSVIMALRDYNTMLSPALMSRKDVMEFNPIFDHCVYVRGPGGKVSVCGKEVDTGIVTDIKAIYSPKFKKEVYTGTSEIVHKYVSGYKKFNQELIEVYEELQKDHYRKFRNNDLKVSERLHRMLIDSYAIVNPDDAKIKYSYRNEQLDIYRVELTIAYNVTPKIGSKITDLVGSKGVVIEVRPDILMPFDPVTGTRADIMMDPSSIPSRMNPGRLYEQYFNGASRTTRALVTKILTDTQWSSKGVSEAWQTVLGFLKIIDTEQYAGYKQVTNEDDIVNVLKEIVEKELYVYYKVSSKKKPYQVVGDLQGTIYEPVKNRIWYSDENGESRLTKDPIRIAPSYIILLAKTADNYLSTASAKTNHYGLPIGVGNNAKHRYPWRNSPVKILSETESRLYVSYGSRLALAELKDRANSIPTHEHVYWNILNASKPTNIDRVVDRAIVPYGNDSAMELVNNIFNSSGIDIVYQHDGSKIHPKQQ